MGDREPKWRGGAGVGNFVNKTSTQISWRFGNIEIIFVSICDIIIHHQEYKYKYSDLLGRYLI